MFISHLKCFERSPLELWRGCDVNGKKPDTIDEYISRYPKDVQQILEKMRKTIRQAAPQAEERISYGMPAFYEDGILVWFAAFKEHIGFYPKPSAIAVFKNDLSKFEGSKGTIRFPIDKPLPLALVGRIVKFRIKQNQNKKKQE
jgi:uncharacterized protein YdhG (YjbR/CyaY superfamily)